MQVKNTSSPALLHFHEERVKIEKGAFVVKTDGSTASHPSPTSNVLHDVGEGWLGLEGEVVERRAKMMIMMDPIDQKHHPARRVNWFYGRDILLAAHQLHLIQKISLLTTTSPLPLSNVARSLRRWRGVLVGWSKRW